MREKLLLQKSFENEKVIHIASSVALDKNGNVIGFILAKAWQEKINVNMNKERQDLGPPCRFRFSRPRYWNSFIYKAKV